MFVCISGCVIGGGLPDDKLGSGAGQPRPAAGHRSAVPDDCCCRLPRVPAGLSVRQRFRATTVGCRLAGVLLFVQQQTATGQPLAGPAVDSVPHSVHAAEPHRISAASHRKCYRITKLLYSYLFCITSLCNYYKYLSSQTSSHFLSQ